MTLKVIDESLTKKNNHFLWSLLSVLFVVFFPKMKTKNKRNTYNRTDLS